jgi:hypothetical protein
MKRKMKNREGCDCKKRGMKDEYSKVGWKRDNR